MASTESLFVTKLYRDDLTGAAASKLNAELAVTCRSFAEDDTAGQKWCAKHNYYGYTSYASLNDLAWRAPVFHDLQKILAKHVQIFARQLAFDLSGETLVLESIWINILPEGGTHSGHIHPNCVISGTYYVAVPKNAASLKFEDPRLAMMMAAPVRKRTGGRDLQPFITIAPQVGTLLLWESWLRHEVPFNHSEEDRISISFNYKTEPKP
jgi:uncharacterized protein (TIGR02466 family)